MMLQLESSIYMILGTSELVDDERLWWEEFIVPSLCDISTGTNAAGSMTKWYRDTIFPEALALEKIGGCDAYQTMMEGVAEIPVGSNGLITLPYFAGERTPVNDSSARGVVFGLTLAHTRAYMYRSGLESMGYSVAQQIALMRNHDNVQTDQIIAVGGGPLSPVWMQIIADILGTPISTPEITIGACFGNALMAALAMGHPGFEDHSSLTRFVHDGVVYHPNPENHEKYKKYQAIYDALYGATADLAYKLSE